MCEAITAGAIIEHKHGMIRHSEEASTAMLWEWRHAATCQAALALHLSDPLKNYKYGKKYEC